MDLAKTYWWSTPENRILNRLSYRILIRKYLSLLLKVQKINRFLNRIPNRKHLTTIEKSMVNRKRKEKKGGGRNKNSRRLRNKRRKMKYAAYGLMKLRNFYKKNWKKDTRKCDLDP